MTLTPVPVEIEQGSEAWLAWRAAGLGASEVASILGLSPWETADQLWQRKLGYAEPRPRTAAMQRGIELETYARFLLEWDHGVFYPPTCFTTVEYDFLKASLDGWRDGVVAECKAPGKTSHTKYLRHGPPDYYRVQMQMQMALSGGRIAWFATYNPDFPQDQQFKAFPVERDDAYIDKMLERVIAFFGCLIRGIPPTEGMLAQSVNGLYATTF